ncbi:hypothetical protein D3C80_1108850 [compost metagenome]
MLALGCSDCLGSVCSLPSLHLCAGFVDLDLERHRLGASDVGFDPGVFQLANPLPDFSLALQHGDALDVATQPGFQQINGRLHVHAHPLQALGLALRGFCGRSTGAGRARGAGRFGEVAAGRRGVGQALAEQHGIIGIHWHVDPRRSGAR